MSRDEIVSLTAGHGDLPARFYLEDCGDAFWYSLDRYAKENRLKVIHVFLAPQDQVSWGKNPRFPSLYFLFIPRKKYALLFQTVASRLLHAKVLIVNTFPTPWAEFPVVLLAKLLGVKIVEFVHEVYDFSKLGLRGKILEAYYRYVYLPLVNAIVNYTHYLTGKLRPPVRKPTFVFPSGVDPTVFRPHKKKSRVKLRVIYVGAIHPVKRIEDIVQAISISGLRKKIILWVIGRVAVREYFEYLLREIRQNRVRCKFFGFVPRDELPPFYSAADVFVNMRPDEAFGKVFIEAMACGTPVIGRKESPGPEEVIQNGWNGYLVRDAEELGSVLRMLLKNRRLLAKMSKNCVKFVQKHYTYEHAYQRLKEILN